MKHSKLLVAACALPLLLSSCGVDKGIVIWSPFGATYSEAIANLIEAVKEDTGYLITHESQGSYPKILTNIKNSIANNSYPHIALGYPDHFADYVKSKIMLDLTPLIEKYDTAHGTKLLDDYYQEYMQENKEIQVGKIYGIPFNKSTEVMVYNVDLFKFIQSKDNTITKVPETWTDFHTDGVKMLKVLHDEGVYGKKVCAKHDNDGNPTEFTVADAAPSGYDVIADYKDFQEASFNLLTFDSKDNLFITLLHQFGSEYTAYTDEEKQSRAQRGHIEFWTPEHKPITINALKNIYQLYDAGNYAAKVFYPTTRLFNSNEFKLGQVLFNVCSSGGLSNNVPSLKFKVGVAPVPYTDATHKYVISQGTNLGLFDKDMPEEELMKCVEIMVKLSTGEMQGTWAATTGYYPSSISATNSVAYQALLNNTNKSNKTKVMYQESAKLNQEEYMGKDKGWIKYTDAAFVGSATIRDKIKTVIGTLCEKKGTIDAAVAGGKTFDQAFAEACETVMNSIKGDLSDYWRE